MRFRNPFASPRPLVWHPRPLTTVGLLVWIGVQIVGIFVLFSFQILTCSGQTITREGVHMRLTSDVADEALLDDLVASFDTAVPQWLAFWGVRPQRATNWKIDGFLMRDTAAFRDRGELPARIPEFQNGFATPSTIWVNFQSSDYYNRHLVLHEGVHSLAFELFGGGGPSWYMEGTAELLATHRDRQSITPGAADGLLAQAVADFRVNDLPMSREESPMWGRYKVVEEARSASRMPTLASVLKLPTQLNGDVDSYTWCWAAAMMLTAYPDTREAFVAASRGGRDTSPAFTTRLYREIGGEWPALRARWRVWLHDLEYGFERERSLVNLSTDDPRDDGNGRTLAIDAGRGWQSAGAWFPAGTVEISAAGQCVIVAEENVREDGEQAEGEEDAIERDWISTPAGITVHSHRGDPIGQLQVCVLPIPSSDDKAVAPLEITALPSESQTIRIERPSWLLFRIHDVPGRDGRYQRADNQGGYQVRLVR